MERRDLDQCPDCGTTIQPELRIDLDFKPLPVCMCGSIHVPGEQVTHPIITA
jgi:hypothetical protein